MVTLQTSPEGQKLFGSGAEGSQSHPSGRHLHWTHSWSAEQVESAGSARGSQSHPGGKAGAQPALVRASGGFATQTLKNDSVEQYVQHTLSVEN